MAYKYQDRVGEEEREGDGYWIYLKPGWIIPGEWTHFVVEDTKRDARAKLQNAVRCDCEECNKVTKGELT